jgi:hypothetical protein
MDRTRVDEVLEGWATVANRAVRPANAPHPHVTQSARPVGMLAGAVVVAILVVALLSRGIGQGPQPSLPAVGGSVPELTTAPSQSPSPSAVHGSILLTKRTLPDVNITLSPPGDVVPPISSDDAYKLCLSGVASCNPESPTAIELALLTDTAYGTVDSKGKLHLLEVNALVWAFSWLGTTDCPPAFGGAGPRPSRPPGQPLCDKVAFVDAHSGKFIFTVSYGHH